MERFLKGIIVGLGGVAPGLSGSVLLIIFGLYQKTLDALGSLLTDLRKNLRFLLPLVAGMFLGVLLFIGPLLDTCTVFIAPISMNLSSILAIYISGFAVNISQGLSTFLVLFLLGNPMLEKLNRIKVKYGMMEGEDGL